MSLISTATAACTAGNWAAPWTRYLSVAVAVLLVVAVVQSAVVYRRTKVFLDLHAIAAHLP